MYDVDEYVTSSTLAGKVTKKVNEQKNILGVTVPKGIASVAYFAVAFEIGRKTRSTHKKMSQ